MSACRAMALVATLHAIALGQTLADRVLVVYNSSDPDSVAVANHYRSARSIPAAHMCAITPPSNTTLLHAQFETAVKGPVRACLTEVGRERILYIVLSWGAPFRVASAARRLFALDSFLADIWDELGTDYAPGTEPPEVTNPYFAPAQSQGNYYPPLVPLAVWRAAAGAKPIYSVWRLDGPTPALAKGLVDKAIAAERTGLTGIGCFDSRTPDLSNRPDFGYNSGDFNVTRAAGLVRDAGFDVVDDRNGALIGVPPAPLRCDGAAFYAGWYSYNTYIDAFTWRPGAIAFHLDSLSAYDVRSGTNWTASLIRQGITITGGSVNEPYLEGLVHVDGFFRNLLQGANAGDAALRNTQWLRWMLVNVGDPLYRPFPGGRAPFHTTRQENVLALSTRSVIGAASLQGVVRIDRPAPAGGAQVALTATSSRVRLPDSVTIPQGGYEATFPVSTTAASPAADAEPLIRATWNGVTSTNSLRIVQELGALVLSSTRVEAGTSVAARVVLHTEAPANGLHIALSSSQAAAVLPASVTVPGGAKDATFTIQTRGVAAAVNAVITARNGNATRTATLTIQPAAAIQPVSLMLDPPIVITGGSSTVRVSLSGPAPAGYSLSLSSTSPSATVPQSISVPAGAQSASFAVTTSLTTGASATIKATGGGASAAATLLVAGLQDFRVGPSAVMPGQPLEIVMIAGPSVPAQGAVVALKSSVPGVASVPASASIPPSRAAFVPVTIGPVTSPVPVRLTGTMGLGSRTVDFTVYPALVSSGWNVPASIKGGTSVQGSVSLTARAPAGGVRVALSSSNPSLIVPPSVTIPAGWSSAIFRIETLPVSSSVPVTITATGPYNQNVRATAVVP